MDYQKVYNSLIYKARLYNRIKSKDIYYENHHIIPKCLGGSNKKDNLVLLTAKEHFVAHKLLVEIYPENSSLIYAYNYMSVKSYSHNRDYKISSREYERLRKKIKTLMSNRTLSQETKDKISKSRATIIVSQETRDKMSKSLTGRKLPESVRKNMSNKIVSYSARLNMSKALRGRIISEEAKKKMSDAWKNRKETICPHCGFKSKNKSVITQFHLDNCKYKSQEVAA